MQNNHNILLDQLLFQATCAVFVEEKLIGTAWLVSDEGHLITAGHILGTSTPVDEVMVRFTEDVPIKAFKIQWGYQQEMGIDFAILKLQSPQTHRKPLPISIAHTASGTFKLHGYGLTLKDQSTGTGDFIGTFDRQNSPSNRLFQLRSSELGEGGYSGGAIFSDNLQAVVAIQTARTKSNTGVGRDTILAMPLYRIAYFWPEITSIAEKLRTTAPNLVSSDILITDVTKDGVSKFTRLGFAGIYNFINEAQEYNKFFHFIDTLISKGCKFVALRENANLDIDNKDQVREYIENNINSDWIGRIVISNEILINLLDEFLSQIDPSLDSSRVMLNWLKTVKLYPSIYIVMDFPGQSTLSSTVISYWNFTPSFIDNMKQQHDNPLFTAELSAKILVEDIYGDIDNLFSAYVSAQ